MKPSRAILSTALFVFGISSSLLAQKDNKQPSPEIEIERLRIQAEERARAEVDQRDWETRIFQIKYVEPRNLRQALSMFRASMLEDTTLRVLSVRAPKEIMPAIEDAIRRLDVASPTKTAELTVYLLMASDQPDTGKTLPAGLQPVVNQLRGVLAYKGFQLVDTLLTRGTDGRDIRLQGTLPDIVKIDGPPGPPPGTPTRYSLLGRFGITNPDGKNPILRISGLQFVLGSVTIGTDVEIPQGQQIVVGKATMGDIAFILVMTAKFPN
jgi:hypothetical protein